MPRAKGPGESLPTQGASTADSRASRGVCVGEWGVQNQAEGGQRTSEKRQGS